MSVIKPKELDESLTEILGMLAPFHLNSRQNDYWHWINEIMDDCYRLQDRVREDMREEKKDEI